MTPPFAIGAFSVSTSEHEQEFGSGAILTFDILIWVCPFGSGCWLLVMNSSLVDGTKMPASWANGYSLFSERSSSFGFGPMMSRNDSCKTRKGPLCSMMLGFLVDGWGCVFVQSSL